MKAFAAPAGVTLVALALVFATPARAEPAPPTSAPAAAAPTPARPSPARDPHVSTPKRAPPSFGRPSPATTPGEVALWIPRVLLSPLYFVSEYVIRWPLSVAIPAAERADLPRKLYDFFTFGPSHNAGIVPVGLVEFDFNPSVGLYGFWNDAAAKGNDWRIHAEAWPDDWYAVKLSESMKLDDERTAQLHVSWVHRPDRVFYGLGPDTLQSNQSRYTEGTLDAGGSVAWRWYRASSLELALGLRSAELGPGHFNGEPSLEQEAGAGAFAIPYGFDRGYTAEYNRGAIVLDTRRPWPAPGSGVRFAADAEEGNDVRRSPGSAWIRYQGAANGFLDLDQHGRVVGVSVMTAFADPLGSAPVPFVELASLGGDGPMRGYFAHRLLDRSAAAASLHYVWPVGPWLGGTIQAAVGNVFGPHLDGFRTDRLRFSSSIGLSTIGVGDYPVEAIFGLGSETFEHGGQIDSFRFTLSVNHGF
jgi:hypothetical protein